MGVYSRFALNLKYSFRRHKPLLTMRLAAAVARAKLPGRPRLRYVDFATHFACNLKCEHCFAETLQSPNREHMTIDDYARVARESMELGAVNFSFQGGEPLADKRLPEIIAACQPAKNVISVTTNGTLLSEKRVAELRRIGVDIVTVSLDSGSAYDHDRFRGRSGVHEAATVGIERVLAHGMHVTIGTVVTHQNLHSEGIRLLCEYAIRKRLLLYFIFPVPAGKWQNETDMLLTEEDEAHVFALTRRSPYLRTDFQANLGGYGCGAAKEILYLTPYGDVLACPFMHISFGNVMEESVRAIRDRALSNPYLDHYHDKCLVSTDREFVNRYLSKTWNASQLPAPVSVLDAPASLDVPEPEPVEARCRADNVMLGATGSLPARACTGGPAASGTRAASCTAVCAGEAMSKESS
ncbi:MAG: radical SAM protein [Planctomycetota bacterium]